MYIYIYIYMYTRFAFLALTIAVTEFDKSTKILQILFAGDLWPTQDTTRYDTIRYDSDWFCTARHARSAVCCAFRCGCNATWGDMVQNFGNFTSQDFDTFLHSCCADSSSPQISAILVGHFTVEHDSLRDSPQNVRKNCADKRQNLGSRNSLVQCLFPPSFWKYTSVCFLTESEFLAAADVFGGLSASLAELARGVAERALYIPPWGSPPGGRRPEPSRARSEFEYKKNLCCYFDIEIEETVMSFNCETIVSLFRFNVEIIPRPMHTVSFHNFKS